MSEVTSPIIKKKIQYIVRDVENAFFGIPSINYMFYRVNDE